MHVRRTISWLAMALAILASPTGAVLAAPTRAITLHAEKFENVIWLPITTKVHNSKAILFGERLYFAVTPGIARVDRDGKNPKVFPLRAELDLSEVQGLLEVDGLIWVVSRHDGLFVFDPKTERFADHFLIGTKPEFAYDGNMSFVEDPYAEAIWFGHFLNVDRYDRKTKTWKNFNSEIARIGIGQPGSSPTIYFGPSGVWIVNQGHAKSTGQTMWCDHAGTNCKLASEPFPKAEEKPSYSDCPQSSLSQFAVCGQSLVERTTASKWKIIPDSLSAFDYPINRVEMNGRNVPLLACRDKFALIVTNSGMNRLDGQTGTLTPVQDGNGFVFSGFIGTEPDGETLAISKQFDGCDTVPPSEFYSYSWTGNRLIKLSSSPSPAITDPPIGACDLGTMHLDVLGSGLRIQGQKTASPQNRSKDQENALAALDMYEMFPEQPDFNQVAGIQSVIATARDNTEKKSLLMSALKTKAGPVAKVYAYCLLSDIYRETREADLEQEQLKALSSIVPAAECKRLKKISFPIVHTQQGMDKSEKIACWSEAQIELVVVPHLKRVASAKSRVQKYLRGARSLEQGYHDLLLLQYVSQQLKQSLSELPVGVSGYNDEVLALSNRTIQSDPDLKPARSDELDRNGHFFDQLLKRLSQENPQLRSHSIYGPPLLNDLEALDSEAAEQKWPSKWDRRTSQCL